MPASAPRRARVPSGCATPTSTSVVVDDVGSLVADRDTRSAALAGTATVGAEPRQQRDRGDLLLAELAPAQCRRACAARPRTAERSLRRDDDVDVDVVARRRDRAGGLHLELVHGRHDHSARPHEPGSGGDCELEIAEPPALAETRTVLAHRDAAGDDEVDRFELVDVDGLRVL